MSLLSEHRNPATTASSHRPCAWRELASRHTRGITVDLYWQPEGEQIFVGVSDELTGESFVPEAPTDAALAAFYHPYAPKIFGARDVMSTPQRRCGHSAGRPGVYRSECRTHKSNRPTGK